MSGSYAEYLEEEVEHEGLHRIVEVVAQGDGVTAQVLGGVVQRAAAELGAQRAGVG